MDHKWKQLILVVNFLFGLRVNEIDIYIGFSPSPSLHLQCAVLSVIINDSLLYIMHINAHYQAFRK